MSFVSNASSAQAELDAALVDADAEGEEEEPLFPLHPQFVGEDVRYLTAAEALRYALRLDHCGRLVDTAGMLCAPDRPVEGMYVVEKGGGVLLYLPGARVDALPCQLRHSSLVAGAAVMAAGQIVVHDGRVVELSNESGHYTPSPSSLQVVMRRLGEQGVAHLDSVVLNVVHREAFDLSHAAFIPSDCHHLLGMHRRGAARRSRRPAQQASSSMQSSVGEEPHPTVDGLSLAQRLRARMLTWSRLAMVPFVASWPVMVQLNVAERVSPFGDLVYPLLMGVYTLTLFCGCLSFSPEPAAHLAPPRRGLRPATESHMLVVPPCPRPVLTVLWVAILVALIQTSTQLRRMATASDAAAGNTPSAAVLIRVAIPATVTVLLSGLGVAARRQRLSAWQVFRAGIAASAASRLLGCVALRGCLGPHGRYPPGNISFAGAVATWSVHLLGSLLAGPRTRAYCQEALTVISLTRGVTLGASTKAASGTQRRRHSVPPPSQDDQTSSSSVVSAFSADAHESTAGIIVAMAGLRCKKIRLVNGS